MPLQYVAHRPKPERSACYFYHYMDFPDGETVTGRWDIRGRFEEYIGNYPLAGKTVMDVGTASGFLAFSAEQAGATVTAFDAADATQVDRIPFGKTHDLVAIQRRLESYHAAFWYAHHKLGSRIEVLYGSIDELGRSGRVYDVVLAGAIIEHLSNPVVAMEHFARIAREAVVIGFTPVLDSDRQVMETFNDWTNPDHDRTWWYISRGLYDRVFGNMGFRVSYRPCTAALDGVEETRMTIVAQRI
jgi:predicted nicotinamide N-methyase